MNPINVLVIDSEVEIQKKIAESYTVLFSKLGYKPNYMTTPNLPEAKKIILSNYLHIVICDLTFNGIDLGLEILSSIHKDFPHLYLILATRGAYNSHVLARKKVHFDLFLEKSPIGAESDEYINWIAPVFLRSFKVNTNFILVEEDSSNNDNKLLTDHPHIEDKLQIQHIVASLSFTTHQFDNLVHPNRIKSTRLSGGFSGSKVYRFNTYNNSSGMSSVLGVLKISKREKAKAEYDNYVKYAKWFLPSELRPECLGYSETKSFGGIAYAFVKGGNRAITPLTDLLTGGQYNKVLKVLEKVLNPDIRRWYDSKLILNHDNIANKYFQRYFKISTNREKSSDVYLETLKRMFRDVIFENNDLYFTISGLSLRLELPSAKIFTNRNSFRSCICHGDLNSNNIILDDEGHIILIDFQETGRSHVFEDFIILETSIRLYGKIRKTNSDLNVLSQEIEFNEYCKKDDSTANFKLSNRQECIKKVRDIAFATFPEESKDNYFFALAAFNYRLLYASLNDLEKITCVSTITAALQFF